MNHSLILGATGVCCLIAISIVTASSLRSLNSTTQSSSRYRSVQHSIANLQKLDAERPSTLGTREPGKGLSAQVSDSLMRAGLPVATMSSLTPDNETSLNSTLRKRTFRLTLQPIRLPELGRFLSDWRTHQPEWRAVSMQCTPLSIDPKQIVDRTSAVPAPISVLIVFETVFAPGAEISSSSSVQNNSSMPANSAPLLR